MPEVPTAGYIPLQVTWVTSTANAAVASLTRLGVAGKHIEMVPVGPLEGFRGEIVGQVPAPGTTLEAATRVTLYVSRTTLADRLPGSLLEPLPNARDEARQTLEPDILNIEQAFALIQVLSDRREKIGKLSIVLQRQPGGNVEHVQVADHIIDGPVLE